MERICIRLCFASNLVLKNLDDQSLLRSTEASQDIAKFLENQISFGLESIRSTMRILKGMKGIPIKVVKDIGITVQQFFKCYSFQQAAPLHISAKKGSLELCQYVIT